SFAWDLLTGRLTWDDRLMETFGYDRSNFDGTIEAFAARIHPDDLERSMGALETAIAPLAPYDAEFRIVLPSGEPRWIQGRGRVLADDAGHAVRLLGAGYDTTQQRHGDARVSRVLEAMN